MNKIRDCLISCDRYSLVVDQEVQTLTKLIEHKIKDLSIPAEDACKMIHDAKSVHFVEGIKLQECWLKCANGHIYCKTERENPIQCPKCKVGDDGKDNVICDISRNA